MNLSLGRPAGSEEEELLRRQAADDAEAAKFRDYFEHSEPVGSIPSHRMLAIRRGEAEGALTWTIEANLFDNEPAEPVVVVVVVRGDDRGPRPGPGDVLAVRKNTNRRDFTGV